MDYFRRLRVGEVSAFHVSSEEMCMVIKRRLGSVKSLYLLIGRIGVGEHVTVGSLLTLTLVILSSEKLCKRM